MSDEGGSGVGIRRGDTPAREPSHRSALNAHHSSSYADAGVDIDAHNRAVGRMRAAVESTHGPRVLTGAGLFGGAYALDGGAALVASADGVGTKVRLASRLGRQRGLGLDIVHHCANDILCLGARPLFFLDYYASSGLDPEAVVAVVEGVAEACRGLGCALLGGETAELPGVYAPGESDVVGFIVGAAPRAGLLDGSRVRAGDALLALPSSGPHTNGYSLINRIIEREGLSDDDLLRPDPALGGALADLLLAPHRAYVREALPLVEGGRVRALAHITGGGLVENVPRALPPGLRARLDLGSWAPPPVFGWLRERGGVEAAEMYRVFNMGAGLVLAVAPADAPAVLEALPGAWELGDIRAGAPAGAELAGLDA